MIQLDDWAEIRHLHSTGKHSNDGDIRRISYVLHGEGSDREIIDVDTARGLIVGYGCEDSDSIGRLQISIADTAPEGVRFAG